MASSPQPLVVDPAQAFLGNDGMWSTFAFEIGTPPQRMSLLPATSGSGIWLPGNTSCVEAGRIGEPLGTCSTSRGGTFNSSASSTWIPVYPTDFPTTNLQFLPAEASTLAVEYPKLSGLGGLDEVVVGSASGSPTINGTYIVAYGYAKAPWVGLWPLSSYGNNPGAANLQEVNSPLAILGNQSLIPSESWGYQAGASYRSGSAYGSLVLGGYDSSRGDGNKGLAVPLSGNLRDLLITIQSISVSGSASAKGLGTVAWIDSLATQMYLPATVCKVFEEAFGLTYNTTVGYYLVNDTQHTRLLNDNRQVTFTLAANATTSQTVDITLPYAAFDYNLTYPMANISNPSTSLRYFPLQPVTDPNQYFLGRVFLQEAYLAVDYGAGQFYVSPAKFPTGMSPVVTCIGCKSSSSGSSSGLSGGAIAGIVIGVLAIIAIIAGVFFGRRYYQKRKLRKLATELTSRGSMVMTDTTATPYNLEPNDDRREYYKPPIRDIPQHENKSELAGSNGQWPTTRHRHELSTSDTVERAYSTHSGSTRTALSPATGTVSAASPLMGGGLMSPVSETASQFSEDGSTYFELPAEQKSKLAMKPISEMGEAEPRAEQGLDPEAGPSTHNRA